LNAFLGFALAVAFGQNTNLTMDEAVAIAMQNAFAVRNAEIQAQKADEQVKATRGATGPTIDVFGNYSHTEQPPPDQAFQGFTNQSDNKTIQLSIIQGVDISGIARAALKAAEFQRDALKAGLDAQLNSVRQLVRAKFLTVLQNQELVRAAEADVAAAQVRLDKANVKYKNDAIPKFDVLRLETDLRKLQQILVDAKQNLQLSKQDLNNTLGRDVDTPFDPVPLDGLPPVEKAPEEYGVAAQVSRAEIRQALLNVKALEKVRDTEWRSGKPSFNASITHTENLDAGFGQSDRSTVGAAQLKVPLFDSGVTKARVQAAERDIEISKVLLEQTQLGVALEVRGALTRVASAKENYEVALSGLELAGESMRLAQLRYDEGEGLLIDLTNAQAEYTRAATAVVNAKYQYLSAYSALQKAVGLDRLDVLPQAPTQEPKEEEKKK
jgi:outer membrane protein TolC